MCCSSFENSSSLIKKLNEKCSLLIHIKFIHHFHKKKSQYDFHQFNNENLLINIKTKHEYTRRQYRHHDHIIFNSNWSPMLLKLHVLVSLTVRFLKLIWFYVWYALPMNWVCFWVGETGVGWHIYKYSIFTFYTDACQIIGVTDIWCHRKCQLYDKQGLKPALTFLAPRFPEIFKVCQPLPVSTKQVSPIICNSGAIQ